MHPFTKENFLIWILLIVLLLFQAVKVYHCSEYVLLNSDFNQIHFSASYLNNDMPPADDQEIGENARYLSLSNLNFAIPLAAAKMDLDPIYYIGLQMLIISPLLFLGLYHCSLELSRNRLYAAFAALLFFYNDFWLFKINMGYPISINRSYNFNDICHVAAVFLLYCCLRGSYPAAALWAAAATMLNPTYGLNLSLLLLAVLVLAGSKGRGSARRTFACLAVVATASACAFYLVQLATPLHIPAPPPARIISILTYGHMAIHVNSPAIYFCAVTLLLILTSLVLALEKMADGVSTRGGIIAPSASRMVLARAMLLYLVGYGIVAYWALYLFYPVLLPVLAPYKALMIIALYLTGYLALGMYVIFLRSRLTTLLLLAPFLLMLLRGRYPAIPYAAWGVLVAALVATVLLVHKKRETLIFPPSQLPVLCVIALLVCDVAYATARPFADHRIEVAAALKEISMRIAAGTEPGALFVPYRLPGTEVNKYGPYMNFALRTFSRRGIIPYHSFGRNAYFDSLMRYQNEERAYSAAGLSLWPDLERTSARLRSENATTYFAGFSLHPSLRLHDSSTLLEAVHTKISLLHSTTDSLTFEEYKLYAKRLGATHVIVCHDKCDHLPQVPLMANDYFAVYKL